MVASWGLVAAADSELDSGTYGTNNVEAVAHAGLPAVDNVRMNPGGTRVVLFRGSGGKRDVAVVDLAKGAASVLPVARSRNTLLDECGWTSDDRIVCSAYHFEASRGPGLRDRRTLRLFAMDHDGGNPLSLVRPPRRPPLVGGGEGRSLLREPRSYPGDEHDHLVLDYLPEDPDHVLLANNREHIENFSVYRLNVRDNRMSLVQAYATGVQFWAADAIGNVRGGVAVYKGNRSQFWGHRRMLVRDGHGFRQVDTPHLGDPHVLPEILGFTDEGDGAYVQARVNGSDRLEVWEFDAATLAPRRPIVVDPLHDVRATPIRGGQCGTVGFVHSNSAGRTFTWLDPQFATVFATLGRRLPDRIERVHSVSRDCSRAVVSTNGRRDRVWYYADFAAGVVRELGAERPGAGEATVSEVSFVAADGTPLRGSLAVPTGRPTALLPLVVYPHGGWDLPGGELDGWSRFLTNLGYAVFRPWSRGTAGFGEAHWEAGFTDWGASMRSDIADGVALLVDAGLVDPGRICYVGRGHGGYMALVAAFGERSQAACAATFAYDDIVNTRWDAAVWRHEWMWDWWVDARSHKRDWPPSPLLAHRGADGMDTSVRSPVLDATHPGFPVLMAHPNRREPELFDQESRRFRKILREAGELERMLPPGHSRELEFLVELAKLLQDAIGPRG